MGCSSPSDPANDPTGTPTSTATGTSTSTSGGTDTSGGASTTGGVMGCISGTASDGGLSLLVNPANNYSFSSTVHLNVQKVAPNTAFNFDWSALTTDITKQPMSVGGGGEVATVLISLMGLTIEEFTAKLNANEALNTFSKGAMAFYPTSETSANLYSFSAPGNVEPLAAEMIDPYLDPVVYPPETHMYAVLVQDSTEPAQGVRMVQALQIDPNSLVSDVTISDSSSDLTYVTDLAAVVPVQVPAATANITVDWKAMVDVQNNGLGNLWTARQVNEVMIGRYDLTPAQLTEQFLGLENIAQELYRAEVTSGSVFNLTALVEETTGAAFAGINGTGTWILALNCGKCTNPAPWFLTILTPCQ